MAMKMDMGNLLAAGLTVLVTGGGTWLVSSTVQSGNVHAAQAVEARRQDDQLHDHELRTRTLEAVMSQMAETQKTTVRLLEQVVEAREEERKQQRQRK
jgi:hypothetical protein